MVRASTPSGKTPTRSRWPTSPIFEDMAMLKHCRTASLALLAGASLLVQGAAAQNAAPDFSSANAGWVSIGTDWLATPGSPPVVTYDPAHRYVPNGSGEQPTFRVADLTNPNLTDFAKESLK